MSENKKIYIVQEFSTRGDDLDCDIIGCYKSYDRARETFVKQLIGIKESYFSIDDKFTKNYYLKKYKNELETINEYIENNNIRFYKLHQEDFDTQIIFEIDELYIDE